MKLVLDRVVADRGEGAWSLTAHGIFMEGIHLVTGDIGSGKTTLALVLAGLVPPASGSVERTGITSSMLSFQFPEYHVTGLTIRDECESWGMDPAQILAATRLKGKEDLSPLRLSRGELKRLHLACLLGQEYDLLMLDEPFSSLDCREKERVCRDLSGRSTGDHDHLHSRAADLPAGGSHLGDLSGAGSHTGGRSRAPSCPWQHAPEIVRMLLAAGKTPQNISPDDLVEAACRT